MARLFVRSRAVTAGHRGVWWAGLLVGLLAGPPLAAQDTPDRAVVRNLNHTLVARKVLLEDADLGRYNIGVKVENRVAYLWGPVGSEALRRRAVDVVRKLPDILDVRSDLYVEDLDAFDPHYLPEPPPRGAASPPPDQLSRSSWQPLPVPSQPVVPLQPIAPAAAESVRFRAVAHEAAPTDEQREEIRLLRPIPVPLPAVLESRALRPDLSPQLAAQVRRLAGNQERFRLLHVTAENGVVHLNGSVYRWEDVHELARAAARLPGVERVVIGRIDTLPVTR